LHRFFGGGAQAADRIESPGLFADNRTVDRLSFVFGDERLRSVAGTGAHRYRNQGYNNPHSTAIVQDEWPGSVVAGICGWASEPAGSGNTASGGARTGKNL